MNGRWKRILSLVMALCMVLGMVPAASAAGAKFPDTQGHWAEGAVDRWTGYGVVNGDEKGDFTPDADITRGALAKIIAETLQLKAEAENTFYDLPAEAWYTPYILKCVAAGIMGGRGNGIMAPEDMVTRQETCKMMATALNLKPLEGEKTDFTDDGSIADWARPYVAAMRNSNYIQGVGEGTFAAEALLTRASAIMMLNNAVAAYVNDAATVLTGEQAGIVIVVADNAKLKDVTVKGNLLVRADGVKVEKAKVDGAMVLAGEKAAVTNTAVTGDVTVSGAGAALDKVTVDGSVAITADKTTVKNSTVKGDLTVEESLTNVTLVGNKVAGTITSPTENKKPSSGGSSSSTPSVTSSSTVILRNGGASALLTVGTSSVTVKTGTTVSTLLSQIKAKDGTSQSYRVTNDVAVEKAGSDVIAEGDQLIVTSSNGKASFTNTLYVKDELNPTKEYWDDVTYSQIDETVNANTPVFKDVDYVVTDAKYMALVHDMEETYNILDPENKDALKACTQTVQNYTPAIQTAINDATAAGGGRVVVPAAADATAENPTVYYTGSIEIKSNVNLHIEENVVLRFVRNITNEYYPMVLSSYEGNDTYNYASPIRSFHAKNIALTGEGTLDPQADNYNWWPWKRGSFGQPNQATVVDILVKEWSDKAYPVEYRLLNDGVTPLPAQIPTMDIDWDDITKVTMIDTPTVDNAGKAITPIKSLLRPCTIEPYASENILIEGIKIINSPMWEVHPLRSRNVLVRGLGINSHGPNNDGVDPESTRNVVIEDCSFDTGDDCIAIKSGKNRDGYSRGQEGGEPSENIIVRDSVFADGHGGVTAGSECTGGVRNVFATDNHYDSVNLDQVLRFKTNSYRGGLIENIYFKDSTVAKAAKAIMFGETQYTAGSAQDKEGDLGPYTPQLKNVYMSNITAGTPDSPVDPAKLDDPKKGATAISYNAYERAPMTNIKVKDVTIYGIKYAFNLINVKNFELDNVKISPLGNPADLTTYNTVPVTLESAKLTVDGKDYPLTEGQKLTLPEDTDKTKNATVSGTIATADAKFAAGTGTVKVYLDRGILQPGNKKPIITPYNAAVTKAADGKYSFTVEVPLADKPDYQYPYRPESEEENMALNNHIISVVATGEVYQQNTWNFSAVVPAVKLNWNTYAMACGKDNDNGETLTLTASYNKSGYSNPQVRWTTEDATIVAPQAEIGDSVVVKSRTTGFVNITASLYDGEKLIGSDVCRITSIDGYDRATMQSLNLSADKLTLNKNGGAVTLTPIFFPVDIPTNGKMDTSLEVVSGYNTGVVTVTLNEDQDYASYADIGNLAKDGVKILYDQVVVTPVAPGTTTFTVKSKVNGRTASCAVTVTEEDLTVTGLTGGSNDVIELTVDGTNTRQLAVTPAGGAGDIIWTSSNPHIASVDQSGLVTARSTSNYEERTDNSSNLATETEDDLFKTVTITATSVQGGFAQTFKVKVLPQTIKATGLTMNQSKLNLAVGTPGYLYANVNPAAILSPEVVWTSSDPSVVEIVTEKDTVFGAAQTKLNPKAAGTATITATYAGFSDTCAVTVTADVVKVANVTLSGPAALMRDQVGQITADVTENATNQKVFWLSTNRTVVTVDREGNVQGYDPGEATVYAIAMDGLTQEQKDILFFTADPDKLADEQAPSNQLGELRNLSADEEGMQKLTDLLASGVVYASHTITVAETEGSRYLRNLQAPDEAVTSTSVALLWNRDSLYFAGDLKGTVVKAGNAVVAELTNEMSYTVKGLTPGTEYTFTITTSYGESASVTETVTVTTKAAPTVVLNVMDAPYNAVGDGSTMDTYAIQKAIDDCPAGGEVYLPAGHIFYSGALFLKSDMTFRVDGTLMGSADPKDYPRIVSRWEGWRKIYQPNDEWAANKGPGSEGTHANQDNEYVYSSLLTLGVYDEGEDGYTAPYNMENVIICGEGQVNANGYSLSYNQGPNSAIYKKGPHTDTTLVRQNVNLRGHTLLTHNVQGLYVTDVMLSNAPAWTLDLIYSREITLDDVSIVSLSNYKTDVNGRNYILNGDGCDVDSSTHVNIVNSFFRAGDDAIAAKSGKNREGWMRGKPTAYLRVTDVYSLGSRYGLIIGSEMAGGAHDLLFQNNEFKDNVSDNSMWIKAPEERGGLVEDIVYRDIINSSVKAAILVNADYSDSYKATPAPVYTRIRRLTYENMIDHSSAASAFTGKPYIIISDVVVRGADFPKAVTVRNVNGVTLIDVPAGYTPNATAQNITVISQAILEDAEIKAAPNAADVKAVDLETKTVTVRKGTTVAQLWAQLQPVKAQLGDQTYVVEGKEAGETALAAGDKLTVTAKNGIDKQDYTLVFYRADEIDASTEIEIIGDSIVKIEGTAPARSMTVVKNATVANVLQSIRATLGGSQTHNVYADKAAAEAASTALTGEAVLANGNYLCVVAQNGTDKTYYEIKGELPKVELNLVGGSLSDKSSDFPTFAPDKENSGDRYFEALNVPKDAHFQFSAPITVSSGAMYQLSMKARTGNSRGIFKVLLVPASGDPIELGSIDMNSKGGLTASASVAVPAGSYSIKFICATAGHFTGSGVILTPTGEIVEAKREGEYSDDASDGAGNGDSAETEVPTPETPEDSGLEDAEPGKE